MPSETSAEWNKCQAKRVPSETSAEQNECQAKQVQAKLAEEGRVKEKHKKEAQVN